MSTLSSLVSDLRNYLKSDPNDKIWGSAVKEAAINTAYFQIQKDGNFRWPQNEATTTQATTGGTAEYALPSDFIRLDMVQFADTLGELFPYSKEMAMRNGTTSQGRPSNYYLFNQKLGFYPTPDTAYTANILYRKKLPTMTVSVDSAFPIDFDPAMVRYAAYVIWSTTKNQAKTAQALQDYQLFLNQLKSAFLFQDANISFGYQRGTSRRISLDPRMLS
jgi:hypothetical protein